MNILYFRDVKGEIEVEEKKRVVEEEVIERMLEEQVQVDLSLLVESLCSTS